MTERIEDHVYVRASEATDHAYCIRSWIGSYTQSPMAREIRAAGLDYYVSWQGVVEQLVRHADLRIACLKASPETIVGFACASLPGERSPSVVHYAYVREQWMGRGVERLLLGPELGKPLVHYTHEPVWNVHDPGPEGERAVRRSWHRPPATWRYRPWWIGVVTNAKGDG